MRKDIVLEGELDWLWEWDDIRLLIGGHDLWDAVDDALEQKVSGSFRHPHVRLTIEFLEEPCVES